jgi:hypothetical protein
MTTPLLQYITVHNSTKTSVPTKLFKKSYWNTITNTYPNSAKLIVIQLNFIPYY